MNPWIESRIEMDDKHPKPNHKHFLLGEGQQRIFIIGQSGCGKTTLLRSIVPMFTDKTTHLFICSCVVNNAIHDKIGEWCKKNGIEYEKFTDPWTARRNIDSVLSEKKLTDHCVIVFDDFMTMNGRSGSGNDPYNLFVTECVNWRRNDNFSIVVICQYYTGLAPRTRVSINRRFVFKCESAHARQLVEMDVSPVFEDSKFTFADCYKKFITGSTYNYLCIGSNPPSVHAVVFEGPKNARIVPIIEPRRPRPPGRISGRGVKSGGRDELGASATDVASVADGEINAGNDSPETLLLSLAEKIVSSKSSRQRAGLIDKFIEVYNDPRVCPDFAEDIISSTGLSKYIDIK